MFGLGSVVLTAMSAAAASKRDEPVVELEETVTPFVLPNNGAGPLWCYGAPLLVRRGDELFLSVMETGRDVPPLCNTRWQLLRRDQRGWTVLRQAEQYQEREPCPLVGAAESLLLSVNPSREPPGTKYGPCDPHLIRFSTDHPHEPGIADRPAWPEGVRFTDHSYRGIAADRESGEVLLLNIHAGTGHQFWCWQDREGAWSRSGEIAFPIRACYPQVALRKRAAHVLAIGDIVEPNDEWRKYKHEQTGRDWDYAFRRLFYAWTPDIRRIDFAPLEVEDVEATAGYLRNLDLWLDPAGDAHLLYLKQSVQSSLMRDRFFPGRSIVHSLEYRRLREGRIAEQKTLVEGTPGQTAEVPGNARFQAAGDGRLFVVYGCDIRGADGSARYENRLLQLLPPQPRPVLIPLQQPFTTFFTAAERGGTPPSSTLDLFGAGREGTLLRCARVRIPDG